MHSVQTFVSLLLAASVAVAGPLQRRQERDTEVRIILKGASELARPVVFREISGREQKNAPGDVFQRIEISVGQDAQQNLRCQALDAAGKPLIAVRGANTDITFSDADKGDWTFQKPSTVSAIVCDPTFVQVGAGASQVRVTLANSQTATQTVFYNVNERIAKRPIAANEAFETIDIRVGELVDPALRCAATDSRGNYLVAKRGENIDVTFSDGGPDKNEWTFENGAKKVNHIVCDPDFVSRN